MEQLVKFSMVTSCFDENRQERKVKEGIAMKKSNLGQKRELVCLFFLPSTS
jgi:hypothetical protein